MTDIAEQEVGNLPVQQVISDRHPVKEVKVEDRVIREKREAENWPLFHLKDAAELQILRKVKLVG